MLYQRGALPRKALALLRASLRRLGDAAAAWDADAVLVQREAMIIGPPVIEWLTTRFGNRPLLLDLDDATYKSYSSPTYGRLGNWLKCFGKTDHLIAWAKVVTCGNRSIAQYVNDRGVRAVIIPTVVDLDCFRPLIVDRTARRQHPVIGWIGSHSTYPYLESSLPALKRLARTYEFELKVIGSGRSLVEVAGVRVTNREWHLGRDVAEFQSCDIGLYPIVPHAWSAGKSGFKAIQYMAVGIPFVVTPVGACAEIGEPGVTHLCAHSQDDWLEALSRLLSDEELRGRMGVAGRAYAERHFTVSVQANKLAAALQYCVNSGPDPCLLASAPGGAHRALS
jgi:glycosyltransferase involved in cell wall biosynthesis